MKILYVANERRTTQPAAKAIRDIAPDIRLAWVGHLSAALRWIKENPDLAALVIEAEVENQNCASFVHDVRNRGVTAPVIVVAPEQVGAPTAALRAGADDYVLDNESLIANLSNIVSALQRSQRTAPPTKQPLRLLYLGDAALARKWVHNPRWSIEITEAVPPEKGAFQSIPPEFCVDGAPRPFDILLV